MKKITSCICILIAVATVISMSGCLKYTSNILEVGNIPTTSPSEYNSAPVEYTTGYSVMTTVPVTSEITTAPSNIIVDLNTTMPEQTTSVQVPVTTMPQTTQPAAKDPSQWTKAEIAEYLNTAVNKTKAYKGNITAAHKESMEATITDITGGNTLKNLANKIVAGALHPTDETLNFSNGTAVSSEKETLQFLLPKDGPFNLPASGIASASASKNGNLVTCKVQVVEEKASINTKPAVNCATMGFLDMSTVDLTGINVTTFDTDYKGSTMEIVVDDSTGYVKSAVFTIPVGIYASGKALGITANISLDAKQVEYWTINW